MDLKDYISIAIALLAFIYTFIRGKYEDRRIKKIEKEREEEKKRLSISKRPVLHVVSFNREDDEDIIESEYPGRVPDSFSEVTLVNVGSPCSKINVTAPANYGFLDTKYAFQKDKITFTFGRMKGVDDEQIFYIDFQTSDGFTGRLKYKIYWKYSAYILQELFDEENLEYHENNA